MSDESLGPLPTASSLGASPGHELHGNRIRPDEASKPSRLMLGPARPVVITQNERERLPRQHSTHGRLSVIQSADQPKQTDGLETKARISRIEARTLTPADYPSITYKERPRSWDRRAAVCCASYVNEHCPSPLEAVALRARELQLKHGGERGQMQLHSSEQSGGRVLTRLDASHQELSPPQRRSTSIYPRTRPQAHQGCISPPYISSSPVRLQITPPPRPADPFLKRANFPRSAPTTAPHCPTSPSISPLSLGPAYLSQSQVAEHTPYSPTSSVSQQHSPRRTNTDLRKRPPPTTFSQIFGPDNSRIAYACSTCCSSDELPLLTRKHWRRWSDVRAAANRPRGWRALLPHRRPGSRHRRGSREKWDAISSHKSSKSARQQSKQKKDMAKEPMLVRVRRKMGHIRDVRSSRKLPMKYVRKYDDF